MIIEDVQPRGMAKILHVEDDIATRHALGRVLQNAGFEVISASNAKEAIARAQDSEVSLVLMDILFSRESANGIEAARLIRRADPQKPIIFVSSFAQDPAFREQIRSAGLESVAFIDKSGFSSAPLLKVIEETVATYRSPEPTEPPVELEREKEVEEPKESGSHLFPHVYQLDHIDLALYSQLQAHPELLKTLDWRRFEELIADIVKTFGYSVELTRPTKDGGVDVIALGRPEPWGIHRYLIQAKQTGRRIGVEPVRELMFLHNDLRATRSCLATTSTFTKGAWELSMKYQWQLELRDYDGLKEWVQKAARIKERTLRHA